ncbi:MAG: TfoX/Sxy family protein [Bacteroidetes bacterium]|nr:TfoX/Sxy family protein [Bacteroidota bacterium]MDA0973152.1 TfoX/Sxy family protein [Bacteroidota bacterium]
MAYDLYQTERLRGVLKRLGVPYEEKSMIGGMCFRVDDKMCFGTHTDKHSSKNLLMVRIGASAVQTNLSRQGAMPMDFTGRPMKDYLFVSEEGYDSEEDLLFWVRLALAFNPLAKASAKRK